MKKSCFEARRATAIAFTTGCLKKSDVAGTCCGSALGAWPFYFSAGPQAPLAGRAAATPSVVCPQTKDLCSIASIPRGGQAWEESPAGDAIDVKSRYGV